MASPYYYYFFLLSLNPYVCVYFIIKQLQCYDANIIYSTTTTKVNAISYYFLLLFLFFLLLIFLPSIELFPRVNMIIVLDVREYK